MSRKSLLVILGLGILAAIAAYTYFGNSQSTDTQVAIKIPPLSETAERGKALYEANCARCHGPSATGSDQGPPFIHRIYEPNHHGDMAFVLAVTRGVRSHHWQFGNMPPVPGLDERDVELIVAYVRQLQKANGIF